MKRNLTLAIILSVLVLVNAVAGGGKEAAPKAQPGSGNPNAGRTLVFIPKATNSQFWVAIWDGAKQAAKELG